jgi:hypothetical protein
MRNYSPTRLITERPHLEGLRQSLATLRFIIDNKETKEVILDKVLHVHYEKYEHLVWNFIKQQTRLLQRKFPDHRVRILNRHELENNHIKPDLYIKYKKNYKDVDISFSL